MLSCYLPDVTEVSLLIQNKGKGVLDVDISTPDFIRLDKTKVQIQENDDQKVNVTVKENPHPCSKTTYSVLLSCASCSVSNAHNWLTISQGGVN